MSKRLWKKVQQNKKRSELRKKREAQVEAAPAGVRIGPSGGETVVFECNVCKSPTTEKWVVFTGESRCERCVVDPSDVILRSIHEQVGDKIQMHLVGAIGA